MTPETSRPLREGEEDRLLALLSHWPFRDQRRGEEFFARAMEHDPTYRPQNVLVAEEEDELVACCQIFPRFLRIAGEAVPAGGIGTVFTREDRRGRGLSTALLEAAVSEMAERGYELSLLHTGLLDWYERRGWRPWGGAPRVWSLASGYDRPRLRGPALQLQRFDPEEHFDEVVELAGSYSADRHGTVVRSEADWRASLALAGNPVEEFVVGSDPSFEHLLVFLRGCMIDGDWQVLEWACAEGHEEHLAELVATTMRTVGQRRVVAPVLQDERLGSVLGDRGLVERRLPEPTPRWMLRCLAPEALAERFGLPAPSDSDGFELLETILPPPAFHFWTADRF